MAGVAAHGRASNRMLTALRQKTQVSTVGIIHQKRNAVHTSAQRFNILHAAQCQSRAGDIDTKGFLPCCTQTLQSTCQLAADTRAAAKCTSILQREPEPTG